MNFLKALLLVVTSMLIVVFAVGNWTPVTINLWGNLRADIKLPLLVLLCVLAGFLPAFAYYRTKGWRANRRLISAERELADMRGFRPYQPPAPADPLPHAEPPQATPRFGAEPIKSSPPGEAA